MGGYIPSTEQERREMLDALGLPDADALFSDVPAQMRVKRLDLPQGMSELETARTLETLAGENTVFSCIYRGAGAYDHYIPAVVKSVTAKESFLTAYTPYQAEISQGILQSIFEYQTMICELTGMDVSNASVYDGASAAAEAAAMCRDRGRTAVYVSAGVHPMTLETIRTYCHGAGAEVRVLDAVDGETDVSAVRNLPADAACVILQQPNFYGLYEDAETVFAAAHAAGAKCVLCVNPIAAAILKIAKDCGADVAVGEGQPLGMPLAFGGPYLGFMAATTAMMRKLPGRIVGETTDVDGKRAFVLTLQAREQHIRREKAGSNICSTQALCALTAAAYMAAMGPDGMRDCARQCAAKAHYLANELEKLGFTRRYRGAFFHEFLTECPTDAGTLLRRLEEKGILGGLPVDGGLLWCVTEKYGRAQLDALVLAVKEAMRA